MRKILLIIAMLLAPAFAHAQWAGGGPGPGVAPPCSNGLDASACTVTVPGGVGRTLVAQASDETNILNILPQASGSTDYTSALNSALNAAVAVYLPNTGTPYRISGSGLVFGSGSTLVCQPGAAITYTGTAQIFVATGSYGAIQNCNFTSSNGSSSVFGSVTGDHFFVDNVTATATEGLFFTGSGAFADRVAHSRFLNSVSSAIVLENSASDADIEYNEINGSIAGFGIWLTLGAHGNLVLGNWTDANPIELVGVVYSSYDNRIIGNRAQKTGDNCFSISGYSNVVVGNKAINCAFVGIYAYGGNNSITGNVILDVGQVHNPSSAYYNAGNTSLYTGLEVSGYYGGSGQNNTMSGNTVYDDQATATTAYDGQIGSGYAAWTTGNTYTGSTTSPGNGAYVYNAGNIYQNQGVSGVAGATAPTCTSGTCSDGTLTWTYISTSPIASREPQGNYFVSNRMYGFAALNSAGCPSASLPSGYTACLQFIDQTINHNNVIDLDYSYAKTSALISGSVSTLDSTIAGGFQHKASTWTSGTIYNSGYTVYTSSGSNRYTVCTPGSGTSTVSPTGTTAGSCASALGDGYSWRYLGTGNQTEILSLSASALGFGSPWTDTVTETGGVVSNYAGAGSPNSKVAANVGSRYWESNGAFGSGTEWVKESGTGNTGWNQVLTNSSTYVTITSGFGTSPSISGVAQAHSFYVIVGTGGTASTGALAMPTAPNGWSCFANDQTTVSAAVSQTRQTASSTTSVTLTNYTDLSASGPWTAGDTLLINCSER